MNTELLVVVGEPSGDARAAGLLRELSALRPELRAFGMTGGELDALGVEKVVDSSTISVVGISEALRVLPQARAAFRKLVGEVDRRGTRLALLVDSPEFNLRLAAALHQRGVQVVYYVSPQVWAWRRYRVHEIRRVVDKMLVLFPFEEDFYAEHGVDAVHVGHPLVDEVPALPTAWERDPDPATYRVMLLPGSRESEVHSNLPVMVEGAQRLAKTFPCEFSLLAGEGISDDLIGRYATGKLDLDVVRGDRFQRLAQQHLAVCASGTATLEVGLVGTPLVMVYRVARWTYWLGRRMVRLPHVGMVNLVLGEGVVKELVQHEATAENIATEGAVLLSDPPRRQSMVDKLGTLRARLGQGGASRRAAQEVVSLLEATDG